jgi:hypothetical protein
MLCGIEKGSVAICVMMFFGDVMSIDEAITRLVPPASRKTA